jgi:hypothetical protein
MHHQGDDQSGQLLEDRSVLDARQGHESVPQPKDERGEDQGSGATVNGAVVEEKEKVKSWFDIYLEGQTAFSKVTSSSEDPPEPVYFSYMYGTPGIKDPPPGTVKTRTRRTKEGRLVMIFTEFGDGWMRVTSVPCEEDEEEQPRSPVLFNPHVTPGERWFPLYVDAVPETQSVKLSSSL